MKISSDTYMMMQATLVASIHSTLGDAVNPAYVKAHIDKLLEANGCDVHDPHAASDQAIKEYYEWKKDFELKESRKIKPKHQ